MDNLFIQNVYDTLSGFLVEEAQVPEVENLFVSGQEGHALVEKVYRAYDRIRDRQGVDAIPEIEEILTTYDEICKLVGCKMFEYGAKFAK